MNLPTATTHASTAMTVDEDRATQDDDDKTRTQGETNAEDN
jgi:hypothetical protein